MPLWLIDIHNKFCEKKNHYLIFEVYLNQSFLTQKYAKYANYKAMMRIAPKSFEEERLNLSNDGALKQTNNLD